jgi:hypothetical protein
VLVALGLDAKLNGCDGPPGDRWARHWFLVVGDRVQHLNSSMTLVDAGDYDSDGRSEVVFWYSGYNKDGYVLFSGGFEKRTEHLWSYH